MSLFRTESGTATFINATNVSASSVFPKNFEPGGGIYIYNSSATDIVHFAFGAAAVAATQADPFVPPVGWLPIEPARASTHIALLLGAVGPAMVGFFPFEEVRR